MCQWHRREGGREHSSQEVKYLGTPTGVKLQVEVTEVGSHNPSPHTTPPLTQPLPLPGITDRREEKGREAHKNKQHSLGYCCSSDLVSYQAETVSMLHRQDRAGYSPPHTHHTYNTWEEGVEISSITEQH